jgi:hypothetical protein
MLAGTLDPHHSQMIVLSLSAAFIGVLPSNQPYLVPNHEPRDVHRRPLEIVG